MKKTKCLLLFLCALSFAHLSFAQKTITISGKVTNDDALPLAGATVAVKGQEPGGVTTDKEGKFSITMPPGSALVFSYVGFTPREIQIRRAQTLNVELTAATKNLDDVVVIGYGTVKKKDLTGSVSSVKAAEIVQTSPVNLEQALQGRAAGVQITSSEGTPDAGVNIRIRGTSSINASSSPLYVVDGFPLPADNVPSSIGLGVSTSSPIRGINPSDIESIEVLKDASSTAIYGSRGANGVVIITTKSGKKGIPKITLETNYGISKVSKYIDVLGGEDFVNYYNTLALAPPVSTEGWQSYRDTVAPYKTLPISVLKVHDWQREVFRNTYVNDNKLTISGGTDYTRYYAGIGVTKSNGILLNSNYTRYSLSFKLEQKITNRIKTGINLNSAFIYRSGLVSATEGAKTYSGVVNDIVKFRPVEPRYLYANADINADGVLVTERGNEIVNPLIRAEKEIQTQRGNQTFVNGFVEIEPIKNLKFIARLGLTYDVNKGRAWYPGEFGWGRFKGGGIALLNHRQNLGWVNENTLTYDKIIAQHHKINVLVGHTAQRGYYEYFQLEGEGFQVPGVNIDNIRSATRQDPGLNISDAQQNQLQSVLGRINYSYKGKYLLTASVRGDGSSKFLPGKKWGYFPSAAIAWNVAEEGFIRNNLPFISTLKLKGSIGVAGNQNIANYQAQSTFTTLAYQFGNATLTGLNPARLTNANLTWESTRQTDFGVELGLLKNRFNISLDIYSKATYNLLLQKPISPVGGFKEIYTNIGKLDNKGVELSVNTVNIKHKDFSWVSNFNIAFNKNTVGNLGIGGADQIFASGLPRDGSYGNYSNDYVAQTGSPVGSIYGWQWAGVYQYKDFTDFDGLDITQSAAKFEQVINTPNATFTLKPGIAPYKNNSPRPGYMRLADISGPTGKPDGVVDELDRGIIGNPTPRHYGGFSNTIQYKDFSVDVLFTWSYGNDIYNKNKIDGLSADNFFSNQLGQLRDAWAPLKESSTQYSINGRGKAAAERPSTFFIEDGSYLRLQNVTLAYNINNKLLKTIKFSNARLFVSINNLHVWTKYSGFDPEVSVGQNALTPGIDFASYPRSKNIRFGISATF
jgi:TonB-dependent starch-binding outer membrane protein SusC